MGSRTFTLAGARGASARIYGHGNARRWGWLHADLGDGDVLELVSAVSTRPGLSALPPLTFLQLPLDGQDLPRDPLFPAPLLRAQLGLPSWRVHGLISRRRLDVRVQQVASADIRLEKLGRGGWRLEREWHLDKTAHAEIGLRP